MTPLLRDSRGIVMMEFIVALVPVMLAFLGMVQFAFAGVATLTVKHSANLAVRAAVVVIEESGASLYDGLQAGILEASEQDPARNPGQRAAMQDAGGQQDDGQGGIMGILQSALSVLNRGESRIKQIRTAAYMPLLAVSPNSADDGLQFFQGRGADVTRLWAKSDTLSSAIGGTGADRIVGAFLYNLGAVAVTFPTAPGSDQFMQGGYDPGEPVTVRVSYLFRCKVPLVSLLLCDSGWSLYSGEALADPAVWWEARKLGAKVPRSFSEIDGFLQEVAALESKVAQRQQRIDTFTGHEDEFKQVESRLIQQIILLRPAARYMVIRAEATLPLQSANYYPRGTEGES